MAYNFSANQFEHHFKAERLGNWEVPRWHRSRPRAHKTSTRIIANDRGHLLPGVHRNPQTAWGAYKGTWQLPNRISRKLATELTTTRPEKTLTSWQKRSAHVPITVPASPPPQQTSPKNIGPKSPNKPEIKFPVPPSRPNSPGIKTPASPGTSKTPRPNTPRPNTPISAGSHNNPEKKIPVPPNTPSKPEAKSPVHPSSPNNPKTNTPVPPGSPEIAENKIPVSGCSNDPAGCPFIPKTKTPVPLGSPGKEIPVS